MVWNFVCWTLLLLRLGAAAEITEEQYRVAKNAQDALDFVSKTRMLSQKVTKEFYFFLFDVQPDKNAQLVRENMAAVIEGCENFTGLIKGITNDFDVKLDKLNETIYKFKDAIAEFEDVFTFDVTTTMTSTTNTLATTTSTTTTTKLRMYLMWPVETGSQAMMDQMTTLWREFTDYVFMHGIHARLYAYDFVDRKRVINQELGKFAVLRALGQMMPLGYSQDLAVHALASLLNRMDAFTLGHYALLEGSAWLGNGMVPDVCLLYQTCVVTYQYEEKVLPELRRVIYRLRQTPEDWERLDREINELLVAVQGNYGMISVVEGRAAPPGGPGGRWNRAQECTHVRDGISDKGWLNAISMLNRNRRVLQEVARIYLQIVKGVNRINRIDRLKLRREEFTTTMNRIIQGYTVDNVPSPPTQDLSETLQAFLFKNWRPIDEIFRQAVEGRVTTFDGRLEGADNTTLILLDTRINLLETLFLEISSLYVRECPQHLRQRCFMVEASYTQAAAYEKMVKEAWFCSLFENSTAFLQRFNYTKDNLTAATVRLVDGYEVNEETTTAERKFWDFKIKRHMNSFRVDPETATSKDEFVAGWQALPGTNAQRVAALRKAYITDNTETSDKSAWMPPSTLAFNASYHNTHRTIHKYYRQLLKDNNYGDLYLFDMESNLLYSVMKKPDFAMNFETGKDSNNVAYSSTLLGQTLREALLEPKVVHVSSWGKYAPSGDIDTSFMCTGIQGDDADTFVGAICIQLPAENGVSLPITRSYCILNELYLVRKYEAQLIEVVESVVYPKNWTDDQMAKFTDAYFNTLYPQFFKVNAYYSQADPTCVASKWLEAASIEQWRAAMSDASMLPSILPMVAKQYFVAQKMDEYAETSRSARIFARSLRAQIDETSKTLGVNLLRDLRLGTLDERLPAAPAQLVATTDVDALTGWDNFVTAISQKYDERNVIPIGGVVYKGMDAIRKIMDALTTYARRSAHSIEELEPALLEKTGVPNVYIEQMAMEASMLSLWQGSPANLSSSVDNFESAVATLQRDQRTQNERCRVQAISKLLDVWGPVKKEYQKFGIKFTYDERQVSEMMNSTEALSVAAKYMQTTFEEVSPTCVLNDSGGIRSVAGIVTVLCGLVVSLLAL